jgi:hypothetical protein
MNASTVRGFAVLAFLCLLPRVSAVTLLSDNRVVSLNGTTVLPQTVHPIAFADFVGVMSGGGLNIGQQSSVTPALIKSETHFSAFTQLGFAQDAVGTSIFDVTFSVDVPTVYKLSSYREVQGLFGISDILFTGPGNTVLANWTGPTGIPGSPNSAELSGVLLPGVYNLNTTSIVALSNDGTINDATSGTAKVTLALGIPDGGSAAFLLLAACLGMLLVRCTARRRS